MQSEDYLKKQIDQFTQALVIILSILTKQSGRIEESVEHVNHQLSALTVEDLDKLRLFSKVDLKHALHLLDSKAMHTLTEVVFELARNNTHYRNLALDLIDLTNEKSESISLIRMDWKRELRKA